MYQFRIGGSLALDDPTYVERNADSQLYTALLNGEFCYVLTSWQMGKSSLRLRTRHRLEAERQGRCAAIDLTRLGSDSLSLLQWYQGLAFELLQQWQLHPMIDLQQWWHEQGNLPPAQIFGNLLDEVLQHRFPEEKLFIFLDEIDSVKGLRFSLDDFFALIRASYNRRAEDPTYERLTWALFGVAHPSDLIRKATHTPFNVGRAIDLPGFSLSDVTPLIEGLSRYVQNASVIMTEILRWTGGQPLLTQKLCDLVRDSSHHSVSEPLTIPPGTEAFWVDNLVHEKMIQHWKTQDQPMHFKTICDRILADERKSTHLLKLYQRLLDADATGILADNSPEQIELQLAGIAVASQGYLRVTNLLYATVFDQNWVTQQLMQQCPYAEALSIWQDSEYLDESRLLTGQALDDAMDWATDKTLSEIEYRYLSASEELNSRCLWLQQEAQERAQMILATARRRARRIMQRGYLVLAACVGIAMMLLLASLLL
jgi:hypothetical protein